MATKGRRAAIYARLSQDRGLEKVSVPRQVNECTELASRLGWEVVEKFQDRDVSASNRTAKRPGYGGLLEALRSGRVNAVLARETSRLYRRPRQLEDLIELIEGKGVEIATVYEGEIDLSTSNGRMMARIRVSVDKQESERLGDRVTSAKKQARAEGKWLGGGRRPYGYNIIDEPGKPRRFTVNRTEARVIRETARRIIGGDSLHRVSVELNERDVRTAGGNRWRPAHLKRLLVRNLPSATFPAILKDNERAVLGARLANAKQKVGRPSGARRYVLTGLVSCSKCGSKMIGSGGNDGNGRRYELYRCASRTGGCGEVSVGALRLEKYVHTRMVNEAGKVILAHRDPEPAEADDLILGTMADLEKRLDALAGDLGLSERVLAARSHAIERELDSLRSKLAAPRDTARPEDPHEVLALTRRLYAKWANRELSDAEVLAVHAAIASVVREVRILPKATKSNPDGVGSGLDERVVIEYRNGETGRRRAR